MSVSIQMLQVPGEVRVGEAFPVVIAVHVDQTATNPGMGIAYVDGPSDSITAAGLRLPKGDGAAVIYSPGEKSPCTTVSPSRLPTIVLPRAGVYRLAFLAGFYRDNVFHVTDRRLVEVAASSAAPRLPGVPRAPGVGAPKPSAPPLSSVAPIIAAVGAGLIAWRAARSPIAGVVAGSIAGLVTYIGVKRV